jgi:hypothetical protein
LANRGARVAALLLRNRVVIWLAVAGVTAFSWLYIYQQTGAMEGMGDIAVPAIFHTLDGRRLALNMAIWWAMMPGMMLPSAASRLFQRWCSPRVI